MNISAESPDKYIESLPDERKKAMSELRRVLIENLPKGFQETISYGMIGYVVPHSTYPDGYHCNPELPLPFINLASQKNFIALYHMGIYADKNLHDWFVANYSKHAKTKLDMGKSCIRFKKVDDIPFELIAQLVSKISPQQWIEKYEENYKNAKSNK